MKSKRKNYYKKRQKTSKLKQTLKWRNINKNRHIIGVLYLS